MLGLLPDCEGLSTLFFLECRKVKLVMSLLDNMRMPVKVGSIALGLGAIMVGLVAYMAARMSAIDLAYADVVTRIDTSATLVARVATRAEIYRATSFELLTELSEGNKSQLLATAQEESTSVLQALEQVQSMLPEKSSRDRKKSRRVPQSTLCMPASSRIHYWARCCWWRQYESRFQNACAV